ncbi:hypothetical protein TNCV_2988211 [Trichonephila clavipes]|nr:hypothetical protein TNCV_2988211 [Trichonephila clavipes]
MKKSSVEFISRSPTPSPMERNYRRTLQRKISMRSTKDQLVKKDVLMPVKQYVFLWKPSGCRRGASHMMRRNYSPLVSMESGKGIRTAADSVQSEWPSQNSMQPKPRSLARRRSELKLKRKPLN